MLEVAGETIVIRRFTGTGVNPPKVDVAVLCRVTGYAPEELVSGIVQGDRRVIALYDDLVSGGFPVPLKVGDKAVIRDKQVNIEAVDDNTRRLAGTLIAYELRVRG